MNSHFRLLLAAPAFLVACACGAGSAQTVDNGSPSTAEAIGAKTMGIESPNTVKQSGGVYGADIGFAKSTVQSERKRDEAQGAAIQSLGAPPR